MKSYDHRIKALPRGYGYRLLWTVDRDVRGSRLRYPTRYHRDADEHGARRFAKRWGIPFPEVSA